MTNFDSLVINPSTGEISRSSNLVAPVIDLGPPGERKVYKALLDAAGNEYASGGGTYAVPNITTLNTPDLVFSNDWGIHDAQNLIVEFTCTANHDATNSFGIYVSAGAGSVVPLGSIYKRPDNAGVNGLDPTTGAPGAVAVPGTGTGQQQDCTIRFLHTHAGGNLTLNVYAVSQNAGDETATWNELLSVRSA